MVVLKHLGLDRLRTKVARFAELLEGIDDPMGEYMVATQRRIDALERKIEGLEQSCANEGAGKKDCG